MESHDSLRLAEIAIAMIRKSEPQYRIKVAGVLCFADEKERKKQMPS
jgi:hypothetical protein